MRGNIIVVILALIMNNPLFAMFSKDDAGTASSQFLKLGVGARAAGMGESYTAVSDDATAIYWNPAGLNRIKGRELSVMHAVWFEDIFYDWVSYTQEIKCGVIGVAAQYLSYGSITGTDSTGLEGSDFTPYDMSVILSYAKKVKGISVGANLKYIGSNIDGETGSAAALDIGGMYELCEDKLSLGLVVQNIGTKMKYIDESESLPLNIKTGAAYKIMDNLLVVADINVPSDDEINISAGSEYSYDINKDLSLAGRAGYNTRNKDTGGTSGITAGIGIGYLKYNLDYAYAPYGDLGNTHRVSLGIKF